MANREKLAAASAGMNIVDMYVGKRLRSLRTEQAMTQKELARRLGVTFQQIQKYEKGLNRLPASRMLAICFALKITPNDLFRDLLSQEYPIQEKPANTDQEQEILNVLRQLAPNQQSQVQQIMAALAEH